MYINIHRYFNKYEISFFLICLNKNILFHILLESNLTNNSHIYKPINIESLKKNITPTVWNSKYGHYLRNTCKQLKFNYSMKLK